MADPVPANPVSAVVAILLADSAIAALVGARAFGGELPASETALMPRRALVVKASGGVSLTSGSYAEHDTIRVDVFAFGAMPREAGDLAALVSLVLRRVERQVAAATLVHWVKSAGGFSSGREPGTEWPRAMQSFQVFHALEAIS
jgi:hypothetical protein